MAEKRLDYLVRLHLNRIGCEVYLFILHQSSENHLIELEMAQYILQQYLKDARQKMPLLGSIPLILNTTVDSAWQPKCQFIDLLHLPDNRIVREGSVNFRIWSINVNDPELTELSREKPIMALLILERLRKKNLSEAEALRIVDDALVVIHAINQEGVYEQMVKLESLLIAANYPENREIIDKLIDKLSRDPHYGKQTRQVQEANMMYYEQRCLEAKQQGLQEGQQKGLQEGRAEGVRHATLKAAEIRFGSDPILMSLIEHAAPELLDDLHTLILQSSTKDDVLQTFRLRQQQ